MRQHLRLNRHSSICAQEPSSSRSSLTKVNWSTPCLVHVIRHSQLIPIIVIRPEKMISLPTQPIAGAAATMICEIRTVSRWGRQHVPVRIGATLFAAS